MPSTYIIRNYPARKGDISKVTVRDLWEHQFWVVEQANEPEKDVTLAAFKMHQNEAERFSKWFAKVCSKIWRVQMNDE